MKKFFLQHKIELLVFSLIAIALFYRIGYLPLGADEPIRSLIAIDMLYDGNYIAPNLNGETYLNKPPLYNWLLLGFIKVCNSFDEWVIRLPSVLSLLLFGGILGWITSKELKDSKTGWIIGFSFMTSGNILIYSSYLGHIDLTYSLITFLQLYLLYHFFQQKKWWQAYSYSYALAFIGFMMKGLPSIAFQGISVIALLIAAKSFKKILKKEHIISGFIFLIPLSVYLFLFSLNGDLASLLERLISESSSRTVTEKSFIESIGHIFTFPFIYLMDILPWGLAAFVFISRKARVIVWRHPFLKACLILFFSNIVIYWLSPDYRARYVFMLTPFLLIPSIYACRKLLLIKSTRTIVSILGILVLLSILGMYLYANRVTPTEVTILAALVLVLLGLFMLFGIFNRQMRYYFYYFLALSLALARISYSYYMIPFRASTGPYLSEKIQGENIAKLTGDEPLAMYNCNVSNTMNWYIAINRNKTLGTVTNDYSLNSFYLVPTQVIKDTSNVTTYFTFVRRYESKPFSLVKFKYRFPEMPK